MVKEIEGLVGCFAWGLGAWGAEAMSGESDVADFFSGASDPIEGLMSEGGTVDFDVAVVVESLDGVLAIASPSPPKSDSGSENSASQCSPLTQLNRAIPTYKPKKHIAPNRIGPNHINPIEAYTTADRAIPHD